MLPRTPASVEIRDLDTGAVQVPERADDGGAYPCLEEPYEIVETVDGIGSDNETGHGRHV